MSVGLRVLRWYDRNKRDLPWRRTRDPYKIWICEVIFQQTRINQGISYYERFIGRFPDLKSLAKASADSVLKEWQGLGYYSRARNLHRTAQYLYNNHYKGLPADYNELLKLKGIGTYTAAAIASIAFNIPVALADGNVCRVLSRYYGIDIPVNSSGARKVYLEKARSILNRKRPGDHNQALMELGALVCLPDNPKCSLCPLKKDCYAFKENKTAVLPVRISKNKVVKRHFTYVVFNDENKNVYIKKRTGKDIWQGLYDFPLVEEQAGDVNRIIKKIAGTGIFRITDTSRTFIHKLSHQIIEAVFVEVSVLSRYLKKKSSWKQVKITDLNKYAFPRLIEKYLSGEGYPV